VHISFPRTLSGRIECEQAGAHASSAELLLACRLAQAAILSDSGSDEDVYEGNPGEDFLDDDDDDPMEEYERWNMS